MTPQEYKFWRSSAYVVFVALASYGCSGPAPRAPIPEYKPASDPWAPPPSKPPAVYAPSPAYTPPTPYVPPAGYAPVAPTPAHPAYVPRQLGRTNPPLPPFGFSAGKFHGLDTLNSEEKADFNYRIDPQDTDYDVAFKCDVPAYAVGVVTFAKVSAGPSRHDIEVVKSATFVDENHLVSSGIITQSAGGGSLPQMLIVFPKSAAWQMLVVVHAQDTNPAKYHVYCDYATPAIQGAAALALTKIVYSFSGDSDLLSGDNIGRATNFAISALWHDGNPLEIGIDVFQEEIDIKLKKIFPDNPEIVMFLTNFADFMVQEMFKHALDEMHNN